MTVEPQRSARHYLENWGRHFWASAHQRSASRFFWVQAAAFKLIEWINGKKGTRSKRDPYSTGPRSCVDRRDAHAICVTRAPITTVLRWRGVVRLLRFGWDATWSCGAPRFSAESKRSLTSCGGWPSLERRQAVSLRRLRRHRPRQQPQSNKGSGRSR